MSPAKHELSFDTNFTQGQKRTTSNKLRKQPVAKQHTIVIAQMTNGSNTSKTSNGQPTTKKPLKESNNKVSNTLTDEPLPVPRRSNFNDEFGRWEEYTRRVGSTILQKQGFVMGKGLGKDLQGRKDIVHAYQKLSFEGYEDTKEETNKEVKRTIVRWVQVDNDNDIEVLEEFDFKCINFVKGQSI